jgi:hypothetical protein
MTDLERRVQKLEELALDREIVRRAGRIAEHESSFSAEDLLAEAERIVRDGLTPEMIAQELGISTEVLLAEAAQFQG